MSFERYTKFYDGGNRGTTIRPHKSAAEFSFNAELSDDTAYKLFTVGETEQYYMWKDEPDGPLAYRSIADSLNSEYAKHDAFCLDFSSKKPETYIKRAYKKIMWPPVLSYVIMNPTPLVWNVGITVTGENVLIEDDGFLQMRIDIRMKKDGISAHSVAGKPDKSIIIPFPTGTYEYEHLATEVEIPSDAAHVGVFVEGKGYSGKVYLEEPHMEAEGENILPCFAPPIERSDKFQWSGQYLSRKELPEFRVKLNGEIVFEGEIFERSHRHSEWEISLPSNLIKNENTVSYELISDYRDALPYTFYEIGLIEQPDGDISLISVQQISHKGGKARILLKTKHENTIVKFESLSPAISGENEYFFEESGLHGILIDCLSVAEHSKFRMSFGNNCVEGEIERIVEKSDDGVITGSGDMIYICQEENAMEEFISWYLSNNVGNFITIRPTYRWSGTKVLNKPMWRSFSRLMDELDMKWVMIADGRELPGIASQPTNSELAGRGYLGCQDHECDGAEYYWRQNGAKSISEEQFLDLTHFAWQEDGEHIRGAFAENSYIYKGDTLYYRSDRDRPHDNALCRDIVPKHTKATKTEGATRHTGPSCMFKYMYEGGYTWLGAETMYSTMEPLLGFLRGFAKDKGMKSYGVHHAVQWSSTPYNEEHVRRFRLALYVAYMLGVTDINTEEGFWHMEEAYNHEHRFDPVCKDHLAAQQDFYRYISSHTRSGEFHTPYAFVSGRDDGIDMCLIDKVWGIADQTTPAEESWDLLRAVYPQAATRTLFHYYFCPSDRPMGFHTSTPCGNADIIAAECRQKTLNDYRSIVFLGYNRMTNEDALKFVESAKNGSTILLTRAHLTKTTDFDAIRQGCLEFDQCALSFTEGNAVFSSDTFNGLPVSVCDNPTSPDEVLLYTDSGKPLLCRYKIGEGEVIIFSVKDYPSSKAIAKSYEEMIVKLAKNAAFDEHIWAETDDSAEFAVYSQADGGSHVYFIAIDWYRDPNVLRNAYLRIGKEKYCVEFPFGVMIKCVCNDTCAAWAESEDGEVLSVSENLVRVQGTGKVVFCIAKNGNVEKINVDFSDCSVKVLEF